MESKTEGVVSRGPRSRARVRSVVDLRTGEPHLSPDRDGARAAFDWDRNLRTLTFTEMGEVSRRHRFRWAVARDTARGRVAAGLRIASGRDGPRTEVVLSADGRYGRYGLTSDRELWYLGRRRYRVRGTCPGPGPALFRPIEAHERLFDALVAECKRELDR